MYVIKGTHERDDDGVPLYWSNDAGWTVRAAADVFSDEDRRTLSLPIGGEWVPT